MNTGSGEKRGYEALLSAHCAARILVVAAPDRKERY